MLDTKHKQTVVKHASRKKFTLYQLVYGLLHALGFTKTRWENNMRRRVNRM